MRRKILMTAALGLLSAGALAGEKKAENKDPNRVICEKQQVVGSRLASKRVCMTAAEWEVRRLEERMVIDKQQTQRGTSGN